MCGGGGEGGSVEGRALIIEMLELLYKRTENNFVRQHLNEPLADDVLP